MIWMLRDFLSYTEQSGRYRNDPGSDIMAAGFVGNRLDLALDKLPGGTILLVKTMGSALAWLVLYFSNSPASHCAIYMGDGTILHATTRGSRRDPVSVLYGRDNRILPFIPQSEKLTINPADFESHSDLMGRPYPWLSVFVKGLRHIFALEPDGFRWEFFFDLLFTAIVTDVILWRFGIFDPLPIKIATAYLFAVLGMRLRSKLHYDPPGNFWILTPARWMNYLLSSEAFAMAADAEALSQWRSDLIELATAQGLLTEEEAFEMRTDRGGGGGLETT